MASRDVGVDIDQTVALDCLKLESLEQSRDFLGTFDSFKLLTLNIRSLQQNFSEFEVALERIDTVFDAIVLTECWINEHSVINHLPGYNVYHTSKYINKSGGVVVYIKESLNVTAFEPSVEDANCLSITISDELKILGIYRSPSFHNVDRFLTSLDRVLGEAKGVKSVAVVGDINIDIIDSSNKQTTNYLHMMAMHGFLPCVTIPTRNDACLDHIFIKSTSRASGAVCLCAITDHEIAMAAIPTSKSKMDRQPRWTTKTDFVAATRQLRAMDWSKVTNSESVNDAVTEFDRIIATAISRNTRQVKVSRAKLNLKPWITAGLIRCMKHRDRLHSKARAAPNDHVLQTIYRRYRNFLDNLLYNLKIEYQSKQLSGAKNNPKKIWKSIKTICNFKNTSNSANELTTLVNSPIESLNICNQHLATIGKKLAVDILFKLSETQSSLASKVKRSDSPANSFFFRPTNINEVDKIISNLKVDSAPGPDSVKPLFIKEVQDVILEPLTHICNLSLLSGRFPDRWKVAQVSPIYKNGPKKDPNNYRPISLLNIFSKILEKIVNSRLVTFLEENMLLSNNQFGFRRGKSTDDATIYLSNKISSFLDRGDKCVGVFLDLCKAFDTVSIDILLSKLNAFGIRGVTHEWFQSYLTERRQYVRVGEFNSAELPISFGIPQGSILGPTLFLIYINDIFKLKLEGAEVLCYADDTLILFRGRSWEGVFDLAECGLSGIATWLENNLLTLNVNKSNYLTFSKSSVTLGQRCNNLKIHSSNCLNRVASVSITCSCNSLVRSDKVKYLGLIIDDKLTFKHHISALTGRVRKCIYVMKQLRRCASEQVLRMVYCALCESILQYGIAAWGSAPKTVLLQLERAQRAVIKVMLLKPILFPTDTLYRESKLLSVRRLYVLKAAVKAREIVINLPLYSQLLEKRVFRVPVPSYRSSLAKRSPDYMFRRIYNNICKILGVQNYQTTKFKVTVKGWLLLLSYQETETLLLAN